VLVDACLALDEVGGLGHWISLQGVLTIAPGYRVHIENERCGRRREADLYALCVLGGPRQSLGRITVS
jgi:hypothetical protein